MISATTAENGRIKTMISREEAIESLERVRELSGLKGCRENIAIDMAIEALSQPERPKGRWVKTKFAGEFICSNCENITYFEHVLKGGYKEYDFCPNCGADMRGEEE